MHGTLERRLKQIISEPPKVFALAYFRRMLNYRSPRCCWLPSSLVQQQADGLRCLSDTETQNERRFTPGLNYSKEKGLRIFNKPSFYEARLTFLLDSVEYYKLSGAHLRTFYFEQKERTQHFLYYLENKINPQWPTLVLLLPS